MALTTKHFFFSESETDFHIQKNDGLGKAHVIITKNPKSISEESIDIVLSASQFDELNLAFRCFQDFKEDKKDETIAGN